jgi:para-nitrobenzyl esterase
MRGLKATPVRTDRLFDATVPEAKEAVLAAYGGARRARQLERFVTDLMFWAPAIEAAAGHATVAPVWMYRFDFAPPALRALGLRAGHGLELDHVMAHRGGLTRRLASLFGADRAARALTGRMSGAWLGFAGSGTAPAWWPRFDDRHRRTWVFDQQDRLETDSRARVREAWRAWQPYG